MIGLHAALLARRTGRPVRMIYDRHEDLAATTKRHPAIVTHRTGVTPRRSDRRPGHRARARRRGVHHADPGRPVARDDPCRRPVRRAARPDPEPGGDDEHAAERGVPRVRCATGRVRRRDPAEPGRRGDRDVARSRSGAGTSTVRAGSRRRCQVLRSGGRRPGGPRARGGGVRVRAWPGRAPRAPAPARTARDRTARGIGLALAWHGAGFTGSGEAKMGSVVSLELTGDGAVRILTRSDGDGPGHEDDPPAARRRRARRADRRGRDRRARHGGRARLRTDGGVADGDGGRRDARRRRRGGCATRSKARTGRPFAEATATTRAAHGPTRIDQPFEPYPGVGFDDATYTGDAYPAFGWAAAVAEVEVDLDTCEVAVLSVVAVDDVGRVIHPVLCEGQVEGGHAAGGRLRDDRGDPAARRPLPQRPAPDLPHPDRARRAPDRHDPRRGARSTTRRTARRASASCRWTSARRPSSRRSTTRRAPGSMTCPRRPSGSWRPLAGIAPPGPPGISTRSRPRTAGAG